MTMYQINSFVYGTVLHSLWSRDTFGLKQREEAMRSLCQSKVFPTGTGVGTLAGKARAFHAVKFFRCL
jgi:hypothetical protein